MYGDYWLGQIIQSVAVGLTIPPSLALFVLSFIKVKREIGPAKRWILYLAVACALYTITAIFLTAAVTTVLVPGSYFAIDIVMSLGALMYFLSSAFILLVMFEVVGWFVDLRNGGAAEVALRSKWAKYVGRVAFALLTILIFVWFGLHARQLAPDSPRNSYDWSRAERVKMSIFPLSALLALILLVSSITILVRTKHDQLLRKASQSFIIAVAFILVPYLWEMITWVIRATVNAPLYWLIHFDVFLQSWSPVVSLGFLYRLASIEIDEQGPFEALQE